MHALATSQASTFVQFFTIIIIFAFVLVITYFTTKWIGGYAKEKNLSENISVVESKRIAPGKYIEIVKIGDEYVAIALGKNEVTFLGNVSKDGLTYPEEQSAKISFKEFLNKAREDKKDN